MQNAYVLTGWLKSPNLIELDESLSLSIQKIKIIIEPISLNLKKKSIITVLKKIQQSQEVRNYIPPSKHEVDLSINQLRNDWNDV